MTEQQTNPSVSEPDELDSVEDFDAYWRDFGKKGTSVRIMGELVTLPPSLPLRFQTEATRLQNSESLEDIAHLCSVLMPDHGDALQRWIDRGMDAERLGIFLLWATQRIAGKAITFADAAVQYAEQLETKQAEGDDTDSPT